MNEKRLLSDLNKNPSVFAKPNDFNLTANGGNGYDHNEGQYGRYGYDHQADSLYDENGHDHADSQNGRYVYDHQADNQYVNGYDHADYQYSGNERNHRADDEYGGCRVIKQIMKDMGSLDASVAMKDTIFVVMIAITSEKIIRVTLTRSNQKKTNSLEGMV